jgi:hypothetical protein
MNLNNLKPAWKQLLLFNSMEPLDREEILYIIEQADRQSITRFPGYITTIIMFIILTACCQGG